MSARTLLAGVLLSIIWAAACNPPPASSLPGTPDPKPSVATATSRPTADPCVAAVSGLAPYVQRLAGDLAALRPLVMAGSFDPPTTKAAVRAVSATLTALATTDRSLAGCRRAAEVAAQLAALRAAAKDPLTATLAASLTDGPATRGGAVALLSLLPDVLALSRTTAGLATDLGLQVALAEVPADATKPIGSLTPFPTPTPEATVKPPAKGKVAAYTATYFGAGTTVKTYRVTGGSQEAIIRSINSRGPVSTWSGGRAEALTAARPIYRFQFVTSSLTGCSIVQSASPAVKITYTITLPTWTPPAGTPAATVAWWNGELASVAKHERHHVQLYRAGQKDLNAALAKSTCVNAQARLDDVWRTINREQCEFDMAEYGTELGLSLKRCITG
jgi:predicted secreted Zn-dependent protease